MKGHLFVISAPSGTGKTTVIKRLLEADKGLALSVSYTTRPARPLEKDGIDYYFVDKEKFSSMVKGNKFIEWAEYANQSYGTPKKEVEDLLNKGVDVLLDIETLGASKVKEKFPAAVLIFLVPPSFDELLRRLETRGMNKGKDLERRVEKAKEELSRRHEYDYQVVNDNIDEACDEVIEIINYFRENE